MKILPQRRWGAEVVSKWVVIVWTLTMALSPAVAGEALAMGEGMGSGVARVGVASWYGKREHGRLMANGKRFDMNALTCASWDYPFGTRLRVRMIHHEGTKAAKGGGPHPGPLPPCGRGSRCGKCREVVVVVTDRGPHRRYVARGRIIDLSRAAFARLAPVGVGLVKVEVAVIHHEATKGTKKRR